MALKYIFLLKDFKNNSGNIFILKGNKDYKT